MAQTQTPTVFSSSHDVNDYTPGSPIFTGDVVLLGPMALVARHDIDLLTTTRGTLATEGIFEVPKDTSVFAAGDPVYWFPTGTPTGGTAGAGCASSVKTNYVMGWATKSRLTADASVFCLLTSSSAYINGVFRTYTAVNGALTSTVTQIGTQQTAAQFVGNFPYASGNVFCVAVQQADPLGWYKTVAGFPEVAVGGEVVL